MKINTAIILCAGYGKRLNPLTLKTPKPLIKLNNITMLERCIELMIKLKIKKIYLNTFYLSEEIKNFLRNKNFSIEIKIINDGNKILGTGGGILNMMKFSDDGNFLIFNPDTLWSQKYVDEINKMQEIYFSKNLNNILLLVNKRLSFDKSLKGDFLLEDNVISINKKKDYIFIGCQILNKSLFTKYKLEAFSIKKIWNDLLKKKTFNGFESNNDFYHLTNLEVLKRLKGL
tara:strand:- start:2568 stop:3257 length:690 start_codon:yes stop_codon:yes gene_type:complete